MGFGFLGRDFWLAFFCSIKFFDSVSSVQSLSHVWLFATPWIAARQASLSITSSRSSPRLTSIESVMPRFILNILCFIFKCWLWDINREFKSYFQADNRKRHKEENNDHLDDLKAAEHAWQKHKQLNESIIVALFQGQFKSTVQCLTCHKKSRTFEAFMYLSLPLASTSKCTLQVN